MSVERVRVAVISSWELVRAGMRSLLQDEPSIDLVDVAASDGHLGGLDVVLYLYTSTPRHTLVDLDHLVRANTHVLLLTPPGLTDLAERARALGAVGTLPISTGRVELVEAIRATIDPGRRAVRAEAPKLLSDRQLAIVELVALGLSNQEIADRLYVSINTVKTNLRIAYQRMGVNNRAKAVAWYLHGRHDQPST